MGLHDEEIVFFAWSSPHQILAVYFDYGVGDEIVVSPSPSRTVLSATLYASWLHPHFTACAV
jgi:hypothetical protein